MNELELIDVTELARRLSVEVSTARRWSREGRIPVIAVGHQIRRYNWAAVVAALSSSLPEVSHAAAASAR